MATRILLVDDEETLRASLEFALQKEGYEVLTAGDGSAALALAAANPPDLILLDVMLPGLDGLEVCRRLRARSSVPILMLTAKDQEIDKILGLELGADDYITKPFSVRELLARMRAVLRRTRPEASDNEAGGMLAAGRVTLNLDRYEVTVDGQPIELSPKEFQLLRLLMLHQGRVLTRDSLIDQVWGDAFMGDLKTLDVHIRWLREKIEEDPSQPRHIVTVRGAGYRFE
jgi:two-component system, OmpR family, response regulator RegX3